MRTLRSIVAGLFVMFISSTCRAVACDGFTDVDSANATYCPAVTYLKDKGITLGCTGTTYCPNDYVTRLQMALFLQRMGRGSASNVLGDWTSVIGGGERNTTVPTLLGQSDQVIGGGFDNRASGFASTVGGGQTNQATGDYSFIGGGFANIASGNSTSTLGFANTASGDTSIAIGFGNSAAGQAAIAAGKFATAEQDLCVVFSLWTGTSGNHASCLGIGNVFRIGADHGLMVDYFARRNDGGGTRYVTIGDISTDQTITAWNGAALTDGGTWASASDAALKAEFIAIDPADVLQRVKSLPIASWRYLSERGQRHVGPTAQDFYAAFSLGADDKHITTVDEGGVALAAIQGLNAKLEATIVQQAHELGELRARMDTLEHRGMR